MPGRILDCTGPDRGSRRVAQRDGGLGAPPHGPGQGVLDSHGVSGQLHRSHAPGRAPIGRLWPRQDVPGGAGIVLHRVGAGGGCPELPLGGVCEGAPGHRGWGHGPHRSGHGGRDRIATEEGGCPGARGRLCRGRVGHGASLWRRHNRVDRLAMDILAGHTPELLPDSAAGPFAEPGQSRRQDGLLRRAGAGRRPHRSHHRSVTKKHLFGRVRNPVSDGRPRGLPRRRIDRGGETSGPAPAGVLPVQLQGFLVLQCHPIPGGGRLDHLPGSRAPHGRHGHGEVGLGKRPAPGPSHGGHSGGRGDGRLHPALDGGKGGVHNRPRVYGGGVAVHERLGDGGRGAQAIRSPGRDGPGVRVGNPAHRRKRLERSA